MKEGAETSYFAALEVKYSRLEERTSGKCTSENVLPKNGLLKLTSENEFPKMDF
jgi:hypothetical protein